MSLAEQESKLSLPANEADDPTLLSGSDLFDYIVTNGLVRTVSADPLGAEYVREIETRLGGHLGNISVEFGAHPENPNNLVVRFLPRSLIESL